MEWWAVLAIILCTTFFVMLVGVPIAFAFILINLLGVFILQGGGTAFEVTVLSLSTSVGTFLLLPVPVFILMGEILWQGGIAKKALEAIDRLLGGLPGRLSLLAVGAGSLFSSLSGSSMATTALLGTTLVPEMEQRGYKKSMTLGPIMASGGLAIIIPPSGMAVIFAALGKLSIGKILIASLIPGLIMAALYVVYIVVRCWLQPSLTPSYEVKRYPWPERLGGLTRHILPLGTLVFLVTGTIVMGMATATEAAALGCAGALVLTAAKRLLTWTVLFRSFRGTVEISVMMLVILAGATGFSQLLAYSGTTQGMLRAMSGIDLPPFVILIGIQVIVLLLGMFMEQIAIMMITLPFFIPLVQSLGFDLIWFAVLMLINLQMAQTTPPFGLLLFVMRSVAPKGTTMREIYLAALPFLACDAMAMAIVMAFPSTALFLVQLAYS